MDQKSKKFTCDWLEKILVVLSDGKVVCGCADPYGERPLGHLADSSLAEIWNSPLARSIRRDLSGGYCAFCEPCSLKRFLAEDEAPPRLQESPAVISRIFLEPTVTCNLDCFESTCNKASGIIKTRSRPFFPYEQFTGLIDSVGRNLVRLDLFNYGEPFLHPRAVEMVEYVKSRFPRVYLYISTNGLLLDPAKNRRLIAAGLDELTFSIDGPDQRTYGKYRRGGDFAAALANISDILRQRREAGRELPLVNWRYIIFRWNDSRRMMNRTRRLAAEIGVDRLTWEITDHPRSAISKRYQPGTASWKRIYGEIWDSSQLSNAIRGGRFLAQIRIVQRPAAGLACGERALLKVKVKNRGGALWRRQTPNIRYTVRLGAQLYDSGRGLLDLNFQRSFLPADIGSGQSCEVTMELPPLPRPGDYWLKLDMVAEGVDWFEKAGSPVAWIPLGCR